jgi:hypothetical protein
VVADAHCQLKRLARARVLCDDADRAAGVHGGERAGTGIRRLSRNASKR